MYRKPIICVAQYSRSGSPAPIALAISRRCCTISSGFIFESRNLLDIPAVFAGLLTVIIISLIVENLIFRTIERNTVQKWGTQS
jgi:hypothetical protein